MDHQKAAGRQPGRARFIKTHVGVGYRFIAAVTRVQPHPVAALVTAHRAFVEGHAAVETMDVEAISRARHRLGAALADAPDAAHAHIDLATACVLEFETSRVPDVDRLDEALAHAESACGIVPATPTTRVSNSDSASVVVAAGSAAVPGRAGTGGTGESDRVNERRPS